jgi:hypothetical protein
VNLKSLQEYITDLRNKNLVFTVLIVKNEVHQYFLINKNFITGHNNFKDDITLLFGGFCFSFMGEFPNIVDDFKSCAYFGADWKVRVNWCNDWATSLIQRMSDKSSFPITPKKWMEEPVPEKSYSAPPNQIFIKYSGDDNLKLWDTLEIETRPITDLTFESANSGGIVKSDGGFPIASKGICWSINPQPTVSDFKTVDGNLKGDYSSHLTGLADYTTYYLRAYAINIKGTTYGNEISFETPESQANKEKYKLNDSWLAADGYGVSISGSAGYFYSFSSEWQAAADAGLVSFASLSFRSITQINKLNWTFDNLWWLRENGVYTTTLWSSGSTIKMSEDGQSFTVTSASPLDVNDVRSKAFSRVKQKSIIMQNKKDMKTDSGLGY